MLVPLTRPCPWLQESPSEEEMGAHPSASESEELAESSESSSEELESPGRWQSESETTSSRESELLSPKATRHPVSMTKESSEQLSPPYRSPEAQQQEDAQAQSPGARTGPEVTVSLGDPEGRAAPGGNDGAGGTGAAFGLGVYSAASLGSLDLLDGLLVCSSLCWSVPVLMLVCSGLCFRGTSSTGSGAELSLELSSLALRRDSHCHALSCSPTVTHTVAGPGTPRSFC